MVYRVEELLEMDPERLSTLYVNGEITALRVVESLPGEKEEYEDFLAFTKTRKCEETAKGYLHLQNRMPKEFRVII